MCVIMSGTEDQLKPVLSISLAWLSGFATSEQEQHLLLDPYDEEGMLKDEVVLLLTDPKSYTNAYKMIFKNEIIERSATFWPLIHNLARHGTYVLEENGITVENSSLSKATPLREESHLGMLDSLMCAFGASKIKVHQVVKAVRAISDFNPSRELPCDIEGCLLLWLNKVSMYMCQQFNLLHKSQQVKSRLMLIGEGELDIPISTKLVEHTRDGQSLAALLIHYAPQIAHWEAFYFTTTSYPACLSEEQSLHNLNAVRDICNSILPPPGFHIRPHYLAKYKGDRTLRSNVIAFLAHCFHCLEVIGLRSVAEGKTRTSRDDLKHRSILIRSVEGANETSSNTYVEVQKCVQVPGRSQNVSSLQNSLSQRDAAKEKAKLLTKELITPSVDGLGIREKMLHEQRKQRQKREQLSAKHGAIGGPNYGTVSTSAEYRPSTASKGSVIVSEWIKKTTQQEVVSRPSTEEVHQPLPTASVSPKPEEQENPNTSLAVIEPSDAKVNETQRSNSSSPKARKEKEIVSSVKLRNASPPKDQFYEVISTSPDCKVFTELEDCVIHIKLFPRIKPVELGEYAVAIPSELRSKLREEVKSFEKEQAHLQEQLEKERRKLCLKLHHIMVEKGDLVLNPEDKNCPSVAALSDHAEVEKQGSIPQPQEIFSKTTGYPKGLSSPQTTSSSLSCLPVEQASSVLLGVASESSEALNDKKNLPLHGTEATGMNPWGSHTQLAADIHISEDVTKAKRAEQRRKKEQLIRAKLEEREKARKAAAKQRRQMEKETRQAMQESGQTELELNDDTIHFRLSQQSQNQEARHPEALRIISHNGPQCYTRPSGKSNRKIIKNALAHVCLAGDANITVKQRALSELDSSSATHFFILFRDLVGFKFRALYSYISDTNYVTRIFGCGPKTIQENMSSHLYKYNSGSKQFKEIHSNSFSISVDALTIKNEYWSRKTQASIL